MYSNHWLKLLLFYSGFLSGMLMICRTVVKTGNNVYPHLTGSFPMEVEALKQFLGPKNKKNLISGNAGNKKNLHPGRHKFFFFNQFSRDILFPFLVSFAFFYFCFVLFVCLLFFEIKNVYSDTHSTMRACEWLKNFHLADFRKQDYFFLLAWLL